jgi:hypothetical protein
MRRNANYGLLMHANARQPRNSIRTDAAGA